MPQRDRAAYIAVAVLAVACAAVFAALGVDGPLPGIGNLPFLPIVVASAALGYAALALFHDRTGGAFATARASPKVWAGILALGALLALPAIAIDLAYPFPQGMNVPLPAALVFYSSVALLAEVAFHLAPLALVAVALPQAAALRYGIILAIAAEPVFQAVSVPRLDLQSWLVFGNVGLISAAQLWLFRRYGFAAMIGLRLAYYAVWHGIWGDARLALLF